MNWKRGLLRAWAVASACWVVTVIAQMGRYPWRQGMSDAEVGIGTHSLGFALGLSAFSARLAEVITVALSLPALTLIGAMAIHWVWLGFRR